MAKITISEAIVRHLWENKGIWFHSYELEKTVLAGRFTGISGNREARRLGESGVYESPNFKYYIERKREGKFAKYRVTQREPLVTLAQAIRKDLTWFDKLGTENEIVR